MIRALRRHWLVVLVSFSVVVGLGVAMAYLPPDRYKATAVVIVEPLPTNATVPVQVIDFIVPSLVARSDSRSFAEQAATRVPADLRDAKVRVNTADTSGAGVLSITVSSTNQKAVAPWATAYAQELVDSGVGDGYVTLSVLDEARRPAQPYAPARRPVVISSVLLGAIVAVLMAIAAAAYRRRTGEADEIRDRLGLTVLGEMPSLRAFDGHGIDVLLTKDAPVQVTEAVQALRSNVEFLLRDQPTRVVAVVSASSGEGKSTISAALAWTLAAVGEPVVAIDADLRRPTLHTYLWTSLTPGLSAVDEVEMADLFLPTNLSTLSVVAAGVPLPLHHPAEVLRANLPPIVAAARDKTVVIDCPPLDGFAETALITQLATSVILVVDRRQHDLLDIERSLAMLERRGAAVLGVVMNRSNRKPAASTYYYGAGPRRVDQDGTDRELMEEARPLSERLEPWAAESPPTPTVRPES